MRLSMLFLMLAAASLSACQTTPAPPPQSVDLVIENVTVIDPETGDVFPNHSVIVDQGRIVSVNPTAPNKQVTARKTLNGSGRFLIPGLMDMHAHLFLPEPAVPSLYLLLANGVTGIREMSSDCWAVAGAKKGCVDQYRQLQSAVRGGQITGPDLLSLTSTMVMGPTRLTLPKGAPSFITPTTEAEGRSLVRHLASRGVDLIKTHDSIPAEVFFAMLDEANRLGVAVGGHVPFAAGSLGSSTRGYSSIEHARDLLYDCSRYGPEYRRLEAAVAEGASGAKRPTNLDRLQRTVAGFDPAICKQLLTALAATDVYYVPTHVTREMEARAGEVAYRNDPSRKFVLADRDARWEADLNETAALPAEERTALRDFFNYGLRITGLAHAAGVPILAGTDANDTMIVPGFSLHRELRLLHSAGLTNMEVLRTATTNAAKYLGRTADLGGISPGKEADLVLLRFNPLQDIRNTASVDAVIANGRLFERPELDALLAEAARIAAKRPS